MKQQKEYYLGLDLGTNSIGWAVTDKQYNLCNFKGKDMWGIRLFESANTAADRRMKRSARRRLERRNDRIKMLQEIFAEEISKVDQTFFIRLNESKLHMEDKSVTVKHPLFADENYTDVEFYKQYPTIFHLRKELIENDKEHDVRLVYLALHHIIKNRGHFLVSGDLNSAKSFVNTFEQMKSALYEEAGLDFEVRDENISEFERILKDKQTAKSVRAKQLLALVAISDEEKTKEQLKTEKTAIEQVCKLLVGNKGDLTKLVGEDGGKIEKSSFSFTDSNYEEVVYPSIEENLPEKCFLIDSIKAVYDWSVLVEILADEDYISYAKVKKYDEHKENLYLLRGLIMKYCSSNVYQQFFNDEKNGANYASYIGYVKKNNKKYSVKKCSEEDFYKNLKKLLETINVNDEDKAVYESLLKKTELQILLPLQRSKDNSVVPRQVHQVELNRILNNASTYLKFLSSADEDGLTPAEKIQSLFEYRVPYYVGPLSDRHKEQGANVWMVRKESGRIYPWNFEKKVDSEKSNEEFIRRMTNKCTYLIGEDVIPKNSLLYSKFMVLNEINNLKVRGYGISVELKQKIYCDLFSEKAKVTNKQLLDYLKKEYCDNTLELSDLSGYDVEGGLKTSLPSYMDFKKQIFGEKIEDDNIRDMVENIIKWITIYGDDKKMKKAVICQEYGNLIEEVQLKHILNLRYSGWGNFSEKFLSGILGIDKETGETFTIIEALWNTNNNLMQLLSNRYTFKEEIDRINKEQSGEISEISYDSLVRDLYVSPANKRTIWQTIQVAEEIKKVMGAAPQKIFVEMARGEEEKKRTQSRKNRLLELYAACDEDVRGWTAEIEAREEREFNSIKLYLYYTQMGRCMYTGETIDLDQLMSDNSCWDRDHIYPQSKIKDDSLDNLVLVRKNVNAKKNNEMLSNDIQKKMEPYWKVLLDRGFISKKKYDRLTRKNDFTDEELAGFISRQLVETRQSSKAVAELLDRIYPDTKVVYVKAGLVSQFRKNDLHMLKSRRTNDFHHAKDAYLNIVVGNVYNAKFTSDPVKWMSENRDKNYSINQVFNFDVKKGEEYIWKAPERDERNKLVHDAEGNKCGGTIDKIRRVMRQNNVLYTEYTYCAKGELFNATIKKKGEGANIPLKKGLDPAKYGGYYSPNTSYFAQVEFDGKKGERVKNIIGVPIYISNMLGHNQNAFIEYCGNIKGMKNVKILCPKIKKNALLIVDGFPMRIRGENELQTMIKNNMQLILSPNREEIIRRLEKFLEKETSYDVDEKFDGFNDEDLIDLYDVMTEKLGSIYRQRPANQYETLVKNREKFVGLDKLKDKAKVINEIVTMLRCDITTTADLSLIGGSKNAGNMAVSKNTVGKSKVVMVNQSVTGLFENRTEL